MEKRGCEPIETGSFPLSHLLHNLFHLLKRNRFGEVLIVLPCDNAGNHGCDQINILAPLVVVFYHDFLKMGDKAFFYLDP